MCFRTGDGRMLTVNRIALFFQRMGIYPPLVSIFSPFRVRTQSCPLEQENTQQQTPRADVSHAHTHAQAGCLAEPQSGKTVQASGFLTIDSITLYLSPVVTTLGRRGAGGLAASMGQCERKERRSAGQRLLRGKPQTWCF